MKIENWFKYERRKMIAKGKSSLLQVNQNLFFCKTFLKNRRKFTKNELNFLKCKILNNPEPNEEQIDSWYFDKNL